MFAGLRRQTHLVLTKTSVLVDHALMDEMRQQLYDRVNSTMEQSSGLFDRLKVSFMLSINAYDDLRGTFDSITLPLDDLKPARQSVVRESGNG